MKIKIFNYDKLKEKDITDRVIRVKALIINDKEEILIGKSFGTVQFPGGHLKPRETLREALIREVKEETGLVLESNYTPFYAIKYYLKNYPESGKNESIEIYYYYIPSNDLYRLDKSTLDEYEKKGDFTLYYIPISQLKKHLKLNVKENPINTIVNREMLLAIKELKQKRKHGYKKI